MDVAGSCPIGRKKGGPRAFLLDRPTTTDTIRQKQVLSPWVYTRTVPKAYASFGSGFLAPKNGRPTQRSRIGQWSPN